MGAYLAHFWPYATETKTHSTKDWTRRHVRAERRYRPPKGRQIRKGLQRGGGSRQSTPPAPLGSRSDRSLPGKRHEDNSIRQMLVVQQRRATVAPSSIRRAPGLGGLDQGTVEER